MTERMTSAEYRRLVDYGSALLPSNCGYSELETSKASKISDYKQKIDSMTKKRHAKYRNKKCVYQNMKFDSEGERDRWIVLHNLQRAGAIRYLERQVYFCVLDGTTSRPIMWVPDFVYEQFGKKIVEDFKSEITRKKRDFIDKVKMFKAKHRDYVILISTDKGVSEWK